uniref:Uncharacterized protein n=1 Tax=Anguilla anguilla TaxID=7936 RepID=A0A0E9QH16_ANGAN
MYLCPDVATTHVQQSYRLLLVFMYLNG